jgi:hypothetical protein
MFLLLAVQIKEVLAMKFINLTFLLIIFVLSVSAQSLPDAPGLMVIKKEWRMDFYNPAFDKSPYSGLEEMQQARQEQKETRRQNEIRARRGLPAKRTPVRTPEPETGQREASVTYIYKLKIKNTGENTIKNICWDYVFLEPGTGREVGREQFDSAANLRPGKTRELIMGSLSPPIDTVDVKDSGKKMRDLYAEQVVIISIEYADGSFWEATEKATK